MSCLEHPSDREILQSATVNILLDVHPSMLLMQPYYKEVLLPKIRSIGIGKLNQYNLPEYYIDEPQDAGSISSGSMNLIVTTGLSPLWSDMRPDGKGAGKIITQLNQNNGPTAVLILPNPLSYRDDVPIYLEQGFFRADQSETCPDDNVIPVIANTVFKHTYEGEITDWITHTLFPSIKDKLSYFLVPFGIKENAVEDSLEEWGKIDIIKFTNPPETHMARRDLLLASVEQQTLQVRELFIILTALGSFSFKEAIALSKIVWKYPKDPPIDDGRQFAHNFFQLIYGTFGFHEIKSTADDAVFVVRENARAMLANNLTKVSYPTILEYLADYCAFAVAEKNAPIGFNEERVDFWHVFDSITNNWGDRTIDSKLIGECKRNKKQMRKWIDAIRLIEELFPKKENQIRTSNKTL